MIWSTVKNNILSTKWLFSGTFKKTKYFGSQNSSNHLSEVAVEKKALWFSSCFLQIRNFLTRPLTLIETHYEITYLSLVDKFVLEVSKWWSMRSTPYVQQLKEKERKEKRLGEKAYDAKKKGHLIFVQKKTTFLVVQLKVYFYLQPDQKEGDCHIW